VRVAVDGLDLQHAVGDIEDADVEGAAAEVEDGDLWVRRLPSWLGIALASPPSMTATAELVVTRSMPMIILLRSPFSHVRLR
jgi:hypothetical protein